MRWIIGIVGETTRYFVSHLPHLLIAPILAVTLVTFLHEGAHAVAVWVQGGTVTDFSITPQPGSFGHMNYEFAPGAFYIGELISLAPYIMWAGMAAFVSVLAFLPIRFRISASTLWVWGYAVPLLDIANAASGYLAGGSNDLTHALGGPDVFGALFFVGLAPLLFLCSFFVQRALYRGRALSFAAYLCVSGAATVGLLIGLAVLSP